MAVEERFTELPTVANSTLSDIICAVQGYVSPSVLGVSTQQTLQQIYNLFKASVIQFNAGNPNGLVAGTTYELCWDTVNNILWICTTSGNAVSAVWTKTIQLTAGTGITIVQSGDSITVSSNSFASNFVVVSTTSAQLTNNTTTQANNGALVTLTLPLTAAAGDIVRVTGLGAGGWSIAQNVGQQIHVGNVSSTVGVAGSVSSSNQFDGIELVCTVADTIWQTIVGPQGSLNVI